MKVMQKEAYLEGNMLLRDWEDSIKENNKMLSEAQIRKIVREGLKKALFDNKELEEVLGYEGDEETETSEEDTGPVDLDEACGDLHDDDVEEELYEGDLDERRRSADGSEAGSHSRGRESDDVALSARLEESGEVTEEGSRHDPDSGYDELQQDRDDAELDKENGEESQEVTVESRLRDKGEFLFEKLMKMWTK